MWYTNDFCRWSKIWRTFRDLMAFWARPQHLLIQYSVTLFLGSPTHHRHQETFRRQTHQSKH
jgi:hypothetical protein